MQPEPAPYEDPSGVDLAAFRRVVGRFATGITIVTTRCDGVDHAMTVNSFTSVSLDPLLVLFCAEKIARFHDAVLSSGLWAVSVLSSDGEKASRWFATRGRPLAGQLEGWVHAPGPRTGVALFADAIAAVECRTRAVYDGGDHSIVLGDVLGVSTPREDGRPLLYYEGRYLGLQGGD